jgi:hypothetical protein
MQIALRAKRFEALLRGLNVLTFFLSAEILPGLRTVHASPVAGSSGGFKRLPWTPARRGLPSPLPRV